MRTLADLTDAELDDLIASTSRMSLYRAAVAERNRRAWVKRPRRGRRQAKGGPA